MKLSRLYGTQHDLSFRHFPAIKKLSQNSIQGGNRGTAKQRVARTLHVRVAKRQEVKLHETAQHDTLWSFEFQVRDLLRLRRLEAVAPGPPRVARLY